ncbi:MAG: ABC transporter ATP-binding protein [Bdellovibrio sp.]|nr:ABC transporter ATP-binding protein [Bdellovibrio sp.]
MNSLYTLESLRFRYQTGRQSVEALKKISCTIELGDFICLSGPSGSGKSTLLNLLGLIEPPQEGLLEYRGQNLKGMTDQELNQIRKFEIGFVFQSFNLFPVLTAQENVEYFLTRQGLKNKERKERSQKALKSVGLWEHRNQKPLEMSGGQRQRVAIARALAKAPRVIIADEPTASLDQKTGQEIMNLFLEANSLLGTTLLVSSHDPLVQKACPIRFHLVDGVLREQEQNQNLDWLVGVVAVPPKFVPPGKTRTEASSVREL